MQIGIRRRYGLGPRVDSLGPPSAASAVVLGLCAVSLLGCAAMSSSGGLRSTPVVLWFDNYHEVLEGRATSHGHFLPGGLDVTSRVGSFRCVGTTQTRIVPVGAEPPEFCDGISTLR